MSATGFQRRRRMAAQRRTQTKQPQAPTFDMSGAWLSTRTRARDAVGAERVPSNKDEARDWLRQAGYTVSE